MSHDDQDPERTVPAQKRSRERRERILETAARVFAEKGLGGATMDAIAHEAGTSIGSLYRFFRDKEAIFQTLHEEHFAKARSFLDVFATEEVLLGPWEFVVRAAIDGVFAFTLGDPGFRAVWASLSFTGAMLEEGELVNREMAERLSPLVARLFPRIAPAHLPVVCTVLVEIVSAMTLVVARREGKPGEKVLDECKELVVRYLAPYAEPPALRPRKKVVPRPKSKAPTKKREGRASSAKKKARTRPR